MTKTYLCAILIICLFPGCSGSSSSDGIFSCETLFGSPSEKTGLDSNQCKSSCDCYGEDFAPPSYTEEEMNAIATRELLNPPELLEANPYDTPENYQQDPDSEKVCDIIVDSENANAYRLETFENTAAAESASATITHYGECGLCSSLKNLAVYMRYGDLTEPVRACAISGGIECLEALGFDLPCAQIWYYNTVNTRAECLTECIAALNEPHHFEDGSLNDCIQCDEDRSGSVFKAVAARTRRNSGLPTALCRPCETVSPVIHNYP